MLTAVYLIYLVPAKLQTRRCAHCLVFICLQGMDKDIELSVEIG